MPVREYDPKGISVIFGGKILHGFSDSEFIKAERNEQSFTLKVGVDGEGTRSKNNNLSGKITITLMQSSLSNDDLSTFQQLDEQSGAGALPFLMSDANGTTLVSALTAWVQKPADDTEAKEVSTRVWVIETDNMSKFTGGNVVAG